MKKDLIIKVCDLIAKYSIYVLVFLTPIFFLPWTTDFLDFNKQFLMLFLVFIPLFAIIVKILLVGKFEIKKSPTHLSVGVLFLIYLLATIFSVYGSGSFWGYPQQISEGLLTLACLSVFYFLVSDIFSKKKIFTLITVLSCSAIIAQIIGIFQLFGKFVAFNTMGSIGSLGFFSATLLPLAIAMLIISKKWWKILFASQIFISLLVLVLINYPIIWWVVVVASLAILIAGMIKRDLLDGRWMALPMFFLVISLFFIFWPPLRGLQIGGLQKANEIFLAQKASFDIAWGAIKERPILGSGPGTFSYDFSKFKAVNFSQSPLWNVTFNRAGSKVLNDLASTGVLGFFALLMFLAFPIFYGVKFVISKETLADHQLPADDNQKVFWILALGLLAGFVAQAFSYFLYGSNFVLLFLNFFMLSALFVLIPAKKKEYILKPSSLSTMITTFVFTLVFIFGLGILVLGVQKYVAEINYYNGSVLWQAGNKDVARQKLESAASMNLSSDLYLRQLSQIYLVLLQDEIKNTKASASSDQEKTKVQTLVSNSVNAAKAATDINSNNVDNWSWRGYVFQSLIGLSLDAPTWAMNSYDAALKLDPNNPYLFAQEGNVYFTQALVIGGSQKAQLLAKAQTQLEKSVALNPNYSNALYSLGLVYDALGQKSKAIAEFTKLQQLNPKDTTIPVILSNLNAGLPALQQPAKAIKSVSPENSGK